MNTSGVNLRQYPALNGVVLTTLSQNSAVYYHGVKQTADGYTWAMVTYNGRNGWIATNYLSLSPTNSPSSSPEPSQPEAQKSTYELFQDLLTEKEKEYGGNVKYYELLYADIVKFCNDYGIPYYNEVLAYEVTSGDRRLGALGISIVSAILMKELSVASFVDNIIGTIKAFSNLTIGDLANILASFGINQTLFYDTLKAVGDHCKYRLYMVLEHEVPSVFSEWNTYMYAVIINTDRIKQYDGYYLTDTWHISYDIILGPY